MRDGARQNDIDIPIVDASSNSNFNISQQEEKAMPAFPFPNIQSNAATLRSKQGPLLRRRLNHLLGIKRLLL